ncbi:MAG TPA: hypothetical protein VF939_06230 [Puia sp.]
MKKSILVLVVGCVSAAILPGRLFSQDIRNQNDLASTQSNNKPVKAAASSYSSSADNAADVNTISLKAIKDFRSRFSGVKDEKWYTLKSGFISYFTQDGFLNRAYYDKKGHWTGSLKYCSENKLPRDIRAIVKSTYYDFTITVIEIAEIPDHLVYLIHLEDAKNTKIVRVSGDGDMDVYQEFTKS